MLITVLGSGTSGGIPEIGCSCPVCRSDDPRNHRTRASILVSSDNFNLLIDTATELRLQCLRENIDHINGVLITHTHADHIGGLDDLRSFSRKNALPVFGSEEAMEDIRRRFSYIFTETQKGGGKPRLELNNMPDVLEFGKMKILRLPVWHGELPVLGFRIGDFAYLTDCNRIPDTTKKNLYGLKALIIDGLRYRPHQTHFNIDEAVVIIKKTGPERAWLTHICHDVDHDRLSRELPENVYPAFDGLRIQI